MTLSRPLRHLTDLDAESEALAASKISAQATLLGVPISVVTETELLDHAASVVETRTPTVFVGVYSALFRALPKDPTYKTLLRRSVTYPDGSGVVTELHRRSVHQAQRLASTDMVHPVVAMAAARGWRVGLYGAAPGVAERAARSLQESTPGLRIVAIWDGYGDEPDVAQVRNADLDLVFVALGAGKQESWAHGVAVAAGVPATFTCGGLFDFLAGDKRRAPVWIQRLSLEWAFRVALEPRRLFARYVLGNTYFLREMARERRRAVTSRTSR